MSKREWEKCFILKKEELDEKVCDSAYFEHYFVRCQRMYGAKISARTASLPSGQQGM